ncbi:MAG: energy transducer TonB [Betaproteobacteria bacterium]|nr:energy transducer TonB [Betaproteobacteria bacterium]
MLIQRGKELSAAIDARLNHLAAVPPPPIALKVRDKLSLTVPMQSSILVSVAFHALLIIGLGFAVSPINLAAPHNVLEVVLVNSKSAKRPDKADALAQANLDGGGNVDDKRRAKSPFPNLPEERKTAEDVKQADVRVKQMEQELKQLMTQANSRAKVVQAEMNNAPSGVPDPATTADLIKRNQEIERLEAQISREYQAYQQRPKRTFVGARTMESRFATYVDGWRVKVERVGNINYPQEARDRNIQASLQMTVAIKANGDIENIEISRSSGHKFLDRAAMRIVRMSGPFEPFPPALKKDTDVLHITRTFFFTKEEVLQTE